MLAVTSTGPQRTWEVTLLDGTVSRVTGREVADMGGRLRFFTGAVVDEVPEVAASFTASLVAHWRVLQ